MKIRELILKTCSVTHVVFNAAGGADGVAPCSVG